MSDNTTIDYRSQYERALQKIELQDQVITVLQQQMAQLQKMVFGSRNERFVPAPPEQLSLGIQAETTQSCSVTEAKKISYTRTKTKAVEKAVVHPGRGKLPEHLRREDIVLEPVEVPQGSKKIGEEISEQLECTPAELYVKRYIRPKYAFPDPADDTRTKVAIAELPDQPIAKGMVGPGLLAQMLIDKFEDHLPAYRQMKRFERSGVKLPYSTIVEWMGAGCELLEVLYKSLEKELLKSKYLHADETGIKVLDQNKAGKKIHQGFFWAYRSSIDHLVLFEYHSSRKKEVPLNFLSAYQGHIQSDGYEAYDGLDKMEGITHFHCMAHARRYFMDALPTDKERAEYVLSRMQKLYSIERECQQRELSLEDRKAVRQEKSVPILEELGRWMKAQYTEKALPKSPIGKALAYSIKRWDKLSLYTQDGMLNIDNNPIENSIRPIALGRKNFLFCGSEESAQKTAMIYSLLACCKVNSVDPYKWLKDVLTRISAHPVNRIKDLLPSYWEPLEA
jgi:transposase